MDQNAPQAPVEGSLSWRLSSHPITLLTFLGFRISSVLVYFLGLWIIKSMYATFLPGARPSGDSKWVFESSEPGTKTINPTDSRFFWLALYVQPVLWVLLAVFALVRLQFLWLPLVVIALVLTIMNTLAFSRCDKFSHASNMAGSALYGGGLASSLASNMVGRYFSRG
ncbi:hypothetical protein VdG1_02835 [Verticillium dahliae VDG1]|nr:hypothetical protein VdG1_02835 [Verticillium dahliae VDG1]